MNPVFGRRWFWPIAFASVLAVAACLYLPGLSAGFLFDDFINLDALGRNGPIVDAPSFWRYVTSGTSDPLGRPLSLLTFLLNARDWPADPAPFLAANLGLHLLNGILLWGLLLTLERSLDTAANHRHPIALLGAGIWLLHPLFVSTTLYVVQREAMLPGTFVLAGLIGYLAGSTRSGTGMSVLAYGSLALATAAASLCKANGVLLPMLAWVLSATILRGPREPRWAHWLFVLFPSVGLLAYVGHFALAWDTTLDGRPWTVGERAWTQGRVLVEYLGLLLLPRVLSPGLFNDGYLVSHGPLSPVTSLLSWLLLLMLLTVGFRYRKRFPRLATALMFFFAGHLLESTLVPLELFFEHRNYVPALLLGWPLAAAIVRAPLARWARSLIGVTVLALLAATTYARVDAWGHPARLAALWATRNPDSARALAMWTEVTIDAGFPDRAATWLRPRWKLHPSDIQRGAAVIDAACAAGGLATEDATAMTYALRNARTASALAQDWLGFRIDTMERQPCNGISLDLLSSWVDALGDNPHFYLRNSPVITDMRGRLALQRGNAQAALAFFDRAYSASRAPDMLLRQSALLDANGHTELGLRHLDHFDPASGDPRLKPFGMPRLHARILVHQHYWQSEVAAMRTRLTARLDSSGRETAE
jgi:protein O-mannosyl-transferase